MFIISYTLYRQIKQEKTNDCKSVFDIVLNITNNEQCATEAYKAACNLKFNQTAVIGKGIKITCIDENGTKALSVRDAVQAIELALTTGTEIDCTVYNDDTWLVRAIVKNNSLAYITRYMYKNGKVGFTTEDKLPATGRDKLERINNHLRKDGLIK